MKNGLSPRAKEACCAVLKLYFWYKIQSLCCPHWGLTHKFIKHIKLFFFQVKEANQTLSHGQNNINTHIELFSFFQGKEVIRSGGRREGNDWLQVTLEGDLDYDHDYDDYDDDYDYGENDDDGSREKYKVTVSKFVRSVCLNWVTTVWLWTEVMVTSAMTHDDVDDLIFVGLVLQWKYIGVANFMAGWTTWCSMLARWDFWSHAHF